MSDVIMISGVDTNKISDGYHTFGELYDHRIQLFIALCHQMATNGDNEDELPWRSVLHSDGSSFEGWFVLGIGLDVGQQITYHLPLSRWEECGFAITRSAAPPFDGHTPADVLERLKRL